MKYFLWFLCLWWFSNMLAHVWFIGKERKKLDHTGAILAVCWYIFLMGLTVYFGDLL